jgi:hypothetical protein
MPLMMRCAAPITLVVLAAALSGCNASAPAPSASASQAAVATTNITPPDFRMPEGSGCAADVARWQAVQQNDLRMGHVGQSVYNQIQTEIAAASAACQAGRSAEASAMVHASKVRHGYPG